MRFYDSACVGGIYFHVTYWYDEDELVMEEVHVDSDEGCSNLLPVLDRRVILQIRLQLNLHTVEARWMSEQDALIEQGR